jgi:hypothetical protein
MSNNALILLLLATPVAIFARNPARDPGNPRLVSCRPSSDPYSLSVLGVVRKTLTDEQLAPVRAAMSLSRIPQDSIALVQIDSLCHKVAKTMADHEQGLIGNLRPVVVRIGAQLWAQDPSLSGGEYPLVYILNREGTRVLGQY